MRFVANGDFNMADHSKNVFFSNEGDRNSVRMRVVAELAKEEPGCGNGDGISRYIYFVKTISSTQQRIFLRRPATINNGFDFVITVEGVNFATEGKRRRAAPTHNDIIDDLSQKQKANPTKYKMLYSVLEKIYHCHDVNDADFQSLEFSVGLDSELIAKVLKWFFIEQDIRFWNYSGRKMLWDSIPAPMM